MGNRHLKLLPSLEIQTAECPDCGYPPCACEYIVKISPDGPLWELGVVAVEQMDKPLPHLAACPCPSCYSDRLRTWGVDS